MIKTCLRTKKFKEKYFDLFGMKVDMKNISIFIDRNILVVQPKFLLAEFELYL